MASYHPEGNAGWVSTSSGGILACFGGTAKHYKPKDTVDTFHSKEKLQLIAQYQQHPAFILLPNLSIYTMSESLSMTYI